MAGTLVLGIGNVLLRDEGAGIHAMRAVQHRCGDRADISCLDGGTLSFTLAGPIEDADALIVLDAASLEASPGTVGVFEGEAMDRFVSGARKSSVHEVGLLDLMAVAALAGRLPARRALVGIQPEVIDWGEVPSEAVARAIPDACGRALELIDRWRT